MYSVLWTPPYIFLAHSIKYFNNLFNHINLYRFSLFPSFFPAYPDDILQSIESLPFKYFTFLLLPCFLYFVGKIINQLSSSFPWFYVCTNETECVWIKTHNHCECLHLNVTVINIKQILEVAHNYLNFLYH